MKSWSRVFVLALALAGLLVGGRPSAQAALGMDREAYGVWDREGGILCPRTPTPAGRNMRRNGRRSIPVGATTTGRRWIACCSLLTTRTRVFRQDTACRLNDRASLDIRRRRSENKHTGLTYGYYLDPEFKIYFSEMVSALAKHLREEVPAHLRDTVALVRVDTGATGDEDPYETPDLGQVPAQYRISDADWRDYRIWVFGLYDQAFQHGVGPVIPLIFRILRRLNSRPSGIGSDQCDLRFRCEVWRTGSRTPFDGIPKRAGFVQGDVHGYSDQVFLRQRDGSDLDKDLFRAQRPVDHVLVRGGTTECRFEDLGLERFGLEGASANGFEFTAGFFNKWAAELDPATAGGGFCIFHEGLDSADTVKFPAASYGSPVNKDNTARYTAICAAYSSQGAQMDHLTAATWGQVVQRRDQTSFNDAGWKIWPGNYERFITQIDPDNTSLGLWRVRGNLTASSHPFDRFGRRFDRATGRNAMYFDVNDRLTPNPGQSIQLSVIYLDSGTNQFALIYDAVGNSQKTAFTVTKANSNTWKTNSVVVTDWVFGNNGPNGADLVLTNVDSSNNTFHSIELIKLADVNVGTVGKGTVSGRTDATVYSPIMGTFMERQRLELTVTPAAGWKFTGWSGELSGTNTRPFLSRRKTVG